MKSLFSPQEPTRRVTNQVKYPVIILCLFLMVASAAAEPMAPITIGGLDGLSPNEDTPSYPVTLALSGGGARGLAAIGVLRAFEEKGLSVAGVTGTSIGGIVGGLYAAGYSPDDLSEIVTTMSLDGLFSNQPSRTTMFITQREELDRHILSVRFRGLRPVIPRALTAGQKLTSILTRLTTGASYRCGRDFNRLPIPYRSVATDIVTGEKIVLDSGSLADAMRATMAFPLAFTPLDRNGQLLMDGGMVSPIPVDLARTMTDTVDFVVAVNTASPLVDKNQLNDPVSIANQATSIMTAEKLRASLDAADYVIRPVIDLFTSSDFEEKDELIRLGYEAGLTAADSIIQELRRRQELQIVTIDSLVCPSCEKDSRLWELIRIGKTMTRGRLVELLKQVVREDRLIALTASNEQSGRQRTTLRIDVSPGISRDDVSLEFANSTVFEDTTLAALLVGDARTIDFQVLTAGRERILEHYRQRGYDLAAVTGLAVDSDLQTVRVVFDEAMVTGIDVLNNDRTRDWFVRSYFPLSKGEPYSTARASSGVTGIFGTDLFDRVAIDLLPRDYGARVAITVEERAFHQLRLGWHWDDRYQSEQFAEFLDDNLLGIGLEYLIHGRVARQRQHAFFKFQANRIFNTYLTSTIRVFYHRQHRDVFEQKDIIDKRIESRHGFESQVGQHMSRWGTLSAGLRFEQVELRYPDREQAEDFGLRSMRFESLVETFDRIPFTRTGKKHFAEIQLTGKALGGEVEFTRFYSTLEAYVPIGRHINLHPKVAVGLSRSNLPPSEKFFLGGMRSFSGYRTDQLAGDKLLHLSHELRFDLPWWFYVTARYDLGQVYARAEDIKFNDLRQGFGVILSLDTPIGPFEGGYGIADNDSERYYLNVGFSF